ncbi:MAG TPA: pilus assembly protein TadG-related protein, partial [Gemmataceae bacterium]|nr:pilus assembly protein TadG-related protein [Gemmataceae bacterium]
MMLSPTRRIGRRAAIAPLAAILLIPLLALTAFAVDMGYIVLIQSDLQNAADSAALAGANKLMTGYVQYNLPGQSTANKANILSTAESSASAAAIQFAGLNNAGVNGLTLLNSDIQFGFTDGSGNYTPNSDSSTVYPNTIKVTLRRDNTANTPLGLFFGPAVGTSSVNLTASAAATIYAANINSFQNTSSLQLGMLPITYDVNAWNN